MENTESTVIAIFTDLADAERALTELRKEGFGDAMRLIENTRMHSPDETLEGLSVPRSKSQEYLENVFGRVEIQADLIEPESILYFTDLFMQGKHVLLVRSFEQRAHVVGVLRTYGAQIDHHGSFLLPKQRRAAPLRHDLSRISQ